MINSRMWLVVNPTVGLPLFLGAVAVGSFSVHVGIVTNTTWVNDFLSGREMGSTDAATLAAAETTTIDGAKLVMERTAPGEAPSAILILEDGSVGTVVFDEAEPLMTASLTEHAAISINEYPGD